ncbi:ABC transporter ATP-binding protein [Saccharibacillus sp. CPCC 101409]|uniref:ABC transporter ATP-binding protein n=1 Tax=Saccharibacillus sp. CPCC 101409 TaxID=3058041 RepID=UPI00267309A0|nr:ABC transporter ATP-binding protein [Saccharibacillus sp. CPCC 101409]MDO3411982.1 ABC transporter ATP-binding protein [Saccharibacillus sp. CPCC 101409]
MRKPVIEFERFTFQYRAQSEPTLHEIDLSIYEGEKVLIVGPSGSGKSTLAHCINGLAPHFYPGERSGGLKIMGEPADGWNIAELSDRIGTVMQDPDGQFVGLTVAEDIAFKLENDGVAHAEMVRRVEEAAAEVDFLDFLNASPQELSGGQKQKTTLAGGLVGGAPILLFDEPLASLDPHAGRSTVELIDRLHRESKRTIVIIEHRLEEMLHCPVDRVIVIDDGRIAADLPPEQLLCSDLLRAKGIREPLHLTALRYAGCEVTPEMRPRSVETIELEPGAGRLRSWYEANAAAPETAVREPLLELNGITFGYDPARPVLRDVSLSVGRGEILCIAGRNGAGKSTISRLICGFHKPIEGSIRLEGRDLLDDSIRERAQRIGFVMQNPNHMLSKPLLYDEAALGLLNRGVPAEEIRERVHETLRVCGLYPFRGWPVSALSYGQKKRATIASILVLRPDILILDEPTAGQDFRHYNEMMRFLLELNRGGMTLILITHDMHLMLEYGQRAIVLSEGRRIADAAPARILGDAALVEEAHLSETSLHLLARRAGISPEDEFVARFIRSEKELTS